MELLENSTVQVTPEIGENAAPAQSPRTTSVTEYLAAVEATTEADRSYATRVSGTMIELIKAINLSKSRAFAQGDSDHSDFVLLIRLVKEGPRRASDLAEQMCFDPSTVSRQVAAMVKSGLIERRADPDDGRASILVPTEAGLARVAEHARVRGMVMAPLVSGWSDAEREIFVRLLGEFSQGITNNLDIVKETVSRLTGSHHSSNHSTEHQHHPRRNS